MELSEFGKKFTSGAGILELMDDLGKAMLTARDALMLGGGNPAHIPEVQALFRQRMHNILDNDDEFERVIGNYDTPQGETLFINALADLLNKNFGSNIKPENIALTNGSQSAFFFLFNLFAGKFSGEKHKKVLLPLAPEYIGYCDLGLSENFFTANKPEIEYIDDMVFKYHVDFSKLEIGDDIGAMCVSRPTNPTGNVLTDDEINKLSEIAKENNIPLIVDNAYGTPFPNIIFTDAEPHWEPHIILCMSLSKLGLPGTRTGIVIADKPIIDAISSMNAILSLAPGSLGVALAYEMVVNNDIIDVSRNIIKPYYQGKAERALAVVREEFAGIDGVHIHKPEGALFLWLWFKDLPISSYELYQRLKERNVLIVSGHYFFPGLDDDWSHKDECIRVSYAMDEDTVHDGLRIIAEEVKKAHG